MQEQQELQAEIIARWTEVHKKSMVMFLIMLALTEQAMWSKELQEWLVKVANWEVSERGLHRTLKRMNHLDLIEHIEVAVPRTGMKRKDYSLTEFGASTLKEMKRSSLKYWLEDSFINALEK